MIKLSPNHLGSFVGASWRSKKACKHVYYKQEAEDKSFFNKPVSRISNYFSRFLIKCFTGIDGCLFLFVLLDSGSSTDRFMPATTGPWPPNHTTAGQARCPTQPIVHPQAHVRFPFVRRACCKWEKLSDHVSDFVLLIFLALFFQYFMT